MSMFNLFHKPEPDIELVASLTALKSVLWVYGARQRCQIDSQDFIVDQYLNPYIQFNRREYTRFSAPHDEERVVSLN
jgi:hypothetical protein